MMACVHKEKWGNEKKNIFVFACNYIKKKKKTQKIYIHTPKKNSDLKSSWEPRCIEYRNRAETKVLYLNTT